MLIILPTYVWLMYTEVFIAYWARNYDLLGAHENWIIEHLQANDTEIHERLFPNNRRTPYWGQLNNTKALRDVIRD